MVKNIIYITLILICFLITSNNYFIQNSIKKLIGTNWMDAPTLNNNSQKLLDTSQVSLKDLLAERARRKKRNQSK